MNDQLIITPAAHQVDITRGLPKTGQTASYGLGDDGYFEAGWWQGRENANNRQRWIAKAIVGDDIVLDRATGLMWAADGWALGCNGGGVLSWNLAIIYCRGLNFAGFTDWRLPNVKELMSIVNYKLSNPAIDEPPFDTTAALYYWSSTTYILNTDDAWTAHFLAGGVDNRVKINTYYLRAVRDGL